MMEEEIISAYRERAAELVSKMTLEEKVFQTMNDAPAIERLGIKSYNWWNEALHGVARAGIATVFPQAIGLAASFDEKFIEEVADAISTEGRAKYNMQQKYEDTGIYKGLTFWAPNINIFRDPRWGRGQETFGEDPYLTSRLGVGFIRGIQGNDKRFLKAAACAKHFAVHSGPERIRHSFNAVVSDKDFYETYTPAFRACVKEANVESVMGAYNRLNGSPCCGNQFLLKELLQKRWGFRGHIVSDCGALKDFYNGHNVVDNPVDAVTMAMNNGCDLNCGNLYLYLLEAVEKGLVKEERLNEALTNLYTTKMKLGMFDSADENPYSKIPYSINDSERMKQLNLHASEKSIVLLKNENGILPLNKKKIKNIGIIGPNANSRKALLGNYEGTASRYVTVSEGIQNYVKDGIKVMQSEGCHLFKMKESNLFLAEVQAVCDESDVVLVCLGLDASYEGEQGDTSNEFGSGDKKDLRFPGFQHKILEQVCKSGKEVVLVVMTGSAMDLAWASEQPIAILQCWYPGALGGDAIARVIFGEKNPEGKLPITLYRTIEELPDFEDYSMEGRTYRFMKQEALYPFGYGMSYSYYDYSEPKLSDSVIGENGISVSVTVKNSGDMDGIETVQVYIHGRMSDILNPELRAIKKVFLKKGESREIMLQLDKKAFGAYDEKGELWLHEGCYEVYVGGSQPDSISRKLTGKECIRLVAFQKEEQLLEK